MGITAAFAEFGAVLKNVNWSVSAENDSGELVVSLWQHYFQRTRKGGVRYVDRVSRWSGHGNSEFRERLDKAFKTNQVVRAVIARTNDQSAVDRGEGASKLKNTFFPKTEWVGKVVVWDGERFEIEFLQAPDA